MGVEVGVGAVEVGAVELVAAHSAVARIPVLRCPNRLMRAITAETSRRHPLPTKFPFNLVTDGSYRSRIGEPV